MRPEVVDYSKSGEFRRAAAAELPWQTRRAKHSRMRLAFRADPAGTSQSGSDDSYLRAICPLHL